RVHVALASDRFADLLANALVRTLVALRSFSVVRPATRAWALAEPHVGAGATVPVADGAVAEPAVAPDPIAIDVAADRVAPAPVVASHVAHPAAGVVAEAAVLAPLLAFGAFALLLLLPPAPRRTAAGAFLPLSHGARSSSSSLADPRGRA